MTDKLVKVTKQFDRQALTCKGELVTESAQRSVPLFGTLDILLLVTCQLPQLHLLRIDEPHQSLFLPIRLGHLPFKSLQLRLLLATTVRKYI